MLHNTQIITVKRVHFELRFYILSHFGLLLKKNVLQNGKSQALIDKIICSTVTFVIVNWGKP